MRAGGNESDMMLVQDKHRPLIRRLAIASRLLVFVLVHVSARLLPLFDASPALVHLHPLLRPLFRWDLFHFFHIARHSYVYEHEWAFFPGLPFIIRYDQLALAVLACDTSQMLYTLSLYHLPSPKRALLATLLSLLPSNPVTAYFSPYTEPFFNYFSYWGMLCCTRQQWFFASLLFALAGMFRSNGIFLAGFIIWGLLVRPFLNRQKLYPITLLKSLTLTTIVLSPFLSHQYLAYISFCSSSPKPQWCLRTLPFIYSYVQSKYWNVGFLRYWTISQLPNFILAAPTLSLIFAYCIHHFRKMLPELVGSMPSRSFKSLAIDPHAIHATIFCLILLFASHTQIVLRLAGSMPITYWAAAWLLSEHHTLGRLWVTWSLLWSLISIVLWTTFLPPA